MKRRSVSQVLLDVLAEAGVRRIYGIPGDAINSLVDAIRQQDTIEFVQVRHEEAGALAASAEAKLTGRLTACAGTAGPGAIHLLNGLYDAKLDHAPVLAITGQVETEYLGSEYHQEVDLYTLFKDVAAFNQVVVNPAQLPHLAVHACQAAYSRRTVAHLSLPVDVAAESVPSPDRRHPVFPGDAKVVPCETDLAAAAELLNRAKRVTMLVGIGAHGATAEVRDVAQRLGAPVIKTLRAKDVLPDDDPLTVGGLGLLGTRPAVEAIESADALLMVGTDFPYHDFYPDGVPAVQVDLEAGQLGKRYPVDVGLLGHARLALPALAKRLDAKEDRHHLKTAQAAMEKWFAKLDRDERSDAEPIRPQRLARTIGDVAADDAIFACDTGAVTVWGARHLRLHGEQRFVLSSSLASMAFALPGALGAQLAFPDRQVVALAGDGGFGMLLGDFLTAVKYELPITVVVFNNGKLGLIQMEQEVLGYPEYQTQLQNPEFAKVAEACGGVGFSVTKPAMLRSTLEEAMAAKKPAVVDVAIHAEERTMPPKILAKQALGYGLAKTREFLGQGDKDGGVQVIADALK